MNNEMNEKFFALQSVAFGKATPDYAEVRSGLTGEARLVIGKNLPRAYDDAWGQAITVDEVVIKNNPDAFALQRYLEENYHSIMAQEYSFLGLDPTAYDEAMEKVHLYFDVDMDDKRGCPLLGALYPIAPRRVEGDEEWNEKIAASRQQDEAEDRRRHQEMLEACQKALESIITRYPWITGTVLDDESCPIIEITSPFKMREVYPDHLVSYVETWVRDHTFNFFPGRDGHPIAKRGGKVILPRFQAKVDTAYICLLEDKGKYFNAYLVLKK